MLKIRRLWVLSVFIVLFAFGLIACAPAVRGLTQLPDEGRLLVLSVITAAVTFLLLKLSEVTGVDLSGYANVAATVLAPILITIIESWLQLIPPAFDNIVLTLIHLVVLLVGSVGTFFLVRRKPASLR